MKSDDYFLITQRYRKIFVRDFSLMTSIGVYDYEHKRLQQVRVNLELWVENNEPEDDFGKVLDYDQVIDAISKVLSVHHELQETLAQEIADSVLLLPTVVAVKVRTEKLEANPNAAAIGVEMFKANA